MLDPTDSNGNYVTCGSAARIDDIWDGGGTVCCWIHTRGSATAGTMVAKQNNSPAAGWGCLHSAIFRLNFECWFSGSNYCFWRTDDSLSANTLHHVAWAYDADSNANDPMMYIDGTSRTVVQTGGAASGTRVSDAAYNLRFSATPTGGGRICGNIADVRMYNRMLSAAEILAIARGRGRDNIVSGLAGRWPLMEGAPGVTVSGSGVVKDLCGASHGTPTGSPIWRGQMVHR